MNSRVLTAIVWLCTLVRFAFAGPPIEIGVTPSEIILRVAQPFPGTYRLIELPSPTLPKEAEAGSVAWEGQLTGTEIRLPRRWEGRDRLTGRFELKAKESGDRVGEPVWVTDLAESGARDFAFPKTTSKKGVNCLVDVEDAKDLGLQHANVNINMRALLAAPAGTAEHTTIVDGHEIAMNPSYVSHLDTYIGGMTSAGISVTGILLNYFDPAGPRDALIHPTTNMADAPNKIGAFNVTSSEGLRSYRAAVQFLVERYTRPGSPHGLMTGMIIGNEVQSHWDWHNQGDVSPEEVLRDYHVAVRVADLIGRSLHARFTTYISMDHRWTRSANGFKPLRSMPGKRFLHEFAKLCREGGDFPWALAFHPYPENLFEPSFWNDRRAPLSLDAPVISFRNIEILPAAMRDPELLHGGALRPIALTEQGFHRKEGAEGEEAQAVALALGYRKIDQMPEIEFFLLHRHQDHPHEGGLNLGVLDGKKRRTKAWAVYRSIDGADWREATEAILGTEPLGGWAAARLSQVTTSKRGTTSGTNAVVIDLFEEASRAELSHVADFRPGDVEMAGEWQRAILQHPEGGKSPARAKYVVKLPSLAPGKKLVLEFATAIAAPSQNGVGFRVIADGKEVFSADQRAQAPEPRQIDLSHLANTTVTLELVVDNLGNSAHDLAAWLEPRIVLR